MGPRVMANMSFPTIMGLCAQNSIPPCPLKLEEWVWINKNEFLGEEGFFLIKLGGGEDLLNHIQHIPQSLDS